MPSEVQVYFRFDPGQRWPPVPSEGLRSLPEDGGYRLLEVPFFVRGVALSDVVEAEPDSTRTLWAGARLRWGGHSTLRVSPRADSLSRPSRAEVLAEFGALGLHGEELEEYDLVALDVPPGIDPAPVKDLLVKGAQDGRWWYEESCVGLDWPDSPRA